MSKEGHKSEEEIVMPTCMIETGCAGEAQYVVKRRFVIAKR